MTATALTPQNKVAETTTDAAPRERAGVHVVVSTGRICGEARDFAIDLDADDLMVTSGGAYAFEHFGRGLHHAHVHAVGSGGPRGGGGRAHRHDRHDLRAGETLLITPYDDLGFGSYKTNEGYLTSKKVVPSVTEYIADHHLSIDKIFVRSQDPVTLSCARAPFWSRSRASA
ncbi:MAG: hypothetical protein ACLR4Z_04275 [Butyricicoccaceae bacterium]